MINKKMIKPVVFMLVSFLLVIIIYFANKKDNEQIINYISASWSYQYEDLEELTEYSDFIGLVKIKDLVQVTDDMMPFCIFETEVLQGILGEQTSEYIQVYITGKVTKDERIELKDDPMFEKGQEFLIFARRNDDGIYTILGGPQGRLEHKKGKLNTLNYVTERVHTMSVNVENKDLEDVVDEIKQYLVKLNDT